MNQEISVLFEVATLNHKFIYRLFQIITQF